MTRILTLLAMLAIASVAPAYAQDARGCKDVSDDVVECTSTTGGIETPIAPTIVRFGEGVVHAPGSELAWVVVANFDAVPIVVTIRFLVQGLGLVTRTMEIPARGRVGYSVHDDYLLTGLRTFSTRVYVPGDAGVSLVLRPAADSWAHTVLPPPDVSRP